MSGINGINSKTSTDYIKEIYDYNGQWDVPFKMRSYDKNEQ